ncbi:glycosyltransferase family 2 protein [Rhodovulum sp. DZ06]|uniref:glycosyltransferase family 2 protein n=1 Tax=Rhodovulum sp. DZ06 TaxID=3425126 RepID=UPI003D329E62
MTFPRAAEEQNIAVAIVSYRTADLVAAQLPALVEELSGFANAAVLIVDNASPDADADRLAAHLERLGAPDWVRLIRSPVNGGFAAGNNLAFAALGDLGWEPHAVLLLNPDAMVRPGAVRRLAAFLAETPRAGVAGVRLENPDGSSWSGAFRFPTPMGEFARGTGLGVFMNRWPVLIPDSDAPARADWVSGACMMVRAEMLAEIGGMDEDYFLYFEEIDYMLKAHRAGWEMWHVPDARVLHDAGGATGIVGGGEETRRRTPAYWFHSWLRYFEKNHGRVTARIAAALKLLGIFVGAAQRRLRGRRSPVAPGFAADFTRRCLLGAQDRDAR